MIPEYRLIHKLVKLKNNKILRKNCKSALSLLKYSKKNKTYSFIFNSNNNSEVFNNLISLDAYLNNQELTTFHPIINSFNFLIAAWRPVYNFQLLYYRDYENMAQVLIKASLENACINEWYQAGLQVNHGALEFLISNNDIPQKIIVKLKVLCHVTGKMFQNLNNNNTTIDRNPHYELGFYLMLFYLLQVETSQSLRFNDSTNWNLKSYFEYSNLFAFKLKIINELNEILMLVKKKDFNLYWRIINYALNGTYDI